MPVSLILTTLNESKSIEPLLNSITKQTQQPDEIVIVDGGSTDNTVELIEKFAAKHPALNVKTYTKKGYNRSQGRNYAIEKAKHSIIAATDAGCVLTKDWLKLITEPFSDPKIGLVAGGYEINSKISDFFQLPSRLASPIPQPGDTTFLPSSRSIAFRKSAWDKVDGYPEYLNTAEDLVFASQLQKKKIMQSTNPKAKVIWHPPATVFGVIRQFTKYAFGDGVAGLSSPHAKKYLIKTMLIILILWAYLNFFISDMILLVSVIGVWLLLSLKAALQSHGNILYSLFWTPFLFLATFLGFWAGWIKHMLTPHHG